MRIITNENSVRYVSKVNSLLSALVPKETNSSKPKTASNPREQNKRLSQKIKKIHKKQNERRIQTP